MTPIRHRDPARVGQVAFEPKYPDGKVCVPEPVSRLDALYLPAAVVTLLGGGTCVAAGAAADLPWLAAIGAAGNLAALGLLVLVGELR